VAAVIFVVASARSQVAGYVETLATVYTIIMLAYILSSLFFSFGGKVPYSRFSSAVLGFLRDVCEPVLGVFRRFIPPIGALDLSPVVAIFVIQFLARIVAGLIRG
jgi:YggT family protein